MKTKVVFVLLLLVALALGSALFITACGKNPMAAILGQGINIGIGRL